MVCRALEVLSGGRREEKQAKETQTSVLSISNGQHRLSTASLDTLIAEISFIGIVTCTQSCSQRS